MRNAGLEESKVGIKIAGRNINNLRYARWYHAYSRKWRTEEPLYASETGEWKFGLKLNIQKAKIMASGPITSWQMGKQGKQRQTLFLGAPKSLQMVIAAMKLNDAYFLEGKLWPT